MVQAIKQRILARREATKEKNRIKNLVANSNCFGTTAKLFEPTAHALDSELEQQKSRLLGISDFNINELS